MDWNSQDFFCPHNTADYVRNNAFCFLVFDITDKKSFENINEYIESFYSRRNSNAFMYLVGNKSDLVN